MCEHENENVFEELEKEIKEQSEEFVKNCEEMGQELKEAAEELAEEIKDETVQEEAAEEAAPTEEDTKKASDSRIFRFTNTGFEVDTDELEHVFRSFGEKVTEAVNSVTKGVSDSLNAAAERNNQRKKADRLAKLLPYMDDEEIHEIAMKVIEGDEDFQNLDIETLVSFMSQEDCALLFEKSLALNDENPGADGRLYLKCVPFVSEDVLTKLVDRYVAGDHENIRMDNIYPYLSSKDVKRIFYYELKK